MKFSKVLIIGIVIAAAVFGLSFWLKPSQGPAPDQGLIRVNEQIADEPVILSDYVRYAGRNGNTALEVLDTITAVETEEFDFGVFVKSINGIEPDEEHFWKLYRNGQEAQIGASELDTKNTDVLEWVLTPIDEEELNEENLKPAE